MSLNPKCPENYVLDKSKCKCRKSKRCPKGYRKDKETGECVGKTTNITRKTRNTERKTRNTERKTANLFESNTTLKLPTKTKTKTRKISKKGKITLPGKTNNLSIIDEVLSNNLEKLKTPSVLKTTKKNTKVSKTKNNKTKKVRFQTVKRTGKRCPKGYRWNPVTSECDNTSIKTKKLTTIDSASEVSPSIATRKTKKKTTKSKTLGVRTKKTTQKTKKSKTLSVTKTKTKITKSRLKELSKTLNKEYSPSINKDIMSMISKSPHKDLFVSINCNLMQITIMSPNGEELCYDWNSKEAKKYMLDNLRSNKKIVPGNIIGPAQTHNNCWMNTFFAIFFLSDKGRKFLRFFRESMITGKVITKTKTKKLNTKVHKAFWILNRFITASLLGTKDLGEYAATIDTNDVVQNLYEALPKKYRYVSSGSAGNPIAFYISILLYIENFGKGPYTPFPLRVHEVINDIEEFNSLSDDIKNMEKIPHMIIVSITDETDEKDFVKKFKKELTIKSGKYKYELDAAAIRDVNKNHVSALITLNGKDYKLDGEDFSPVRKFKWKNLLNTNKSFKITKTIPEKYNFTKSYQALIYYRTK